MKTIAFQTDDDALHAAFNKTLRTLAGQPNGLKMLTPVLLALDLAVKVEDQKGFMQAIGQYGVTAQMLRMAKIAAGELQDDCDCIHCANRRASESCEKAQDTENLPDTFVRYYLHLSKQRAFEEQPVGTWQEAYTEWKSFSLEQRLSFCESSNWSYVVEAKKKLAEMCNDPKHGGMAS